MAPGRRIWSSTFFLCYTPTLWPEISCGIPVRHICPSFPSASYSFGCPLVVQPKAGPVSRKTSKSTAGCPPHGLGQTLHPSGSVSRLSADRTGSFMSLPCVRSFWLLVTHVLKISKHVQAYLGLWSQMMSIFLWCCLCFLMGASRWFVCSSYVCHMCKWSFMMSISPLTLNINIINPR